MTPTPITGGCLCGRLRYAASAAPTMAGFCCCADCRKASGAGAIAVMRFPASALRITGAARQHRTISIRGTDAVRNFCPDCGGLVFGGVLGADEQHSIYAGSLDDPSRFTPTFAIFLRNKPDWVTLPPGLRVFATMPGL
jgi:hypothetical protein